MRRRPKLSLKTRFIALTVAGELLFGTALGVTAALYATRAEAHERVSLMQHTTATIAASVMPLIVDRDEERVTAQLESVLAVQGADEIRAIWILDSSGNEIAAAPSMGVQPPPAEGTSLLGVLTDPQTLDWPITVDGIEIARVRALFAPLGLREAFGSPLLLAALVALGVLCVSLPWTAWLFVRNVAEPLEELREGALQLAGDHHAEPLYDGRGDEIGDVQRALDDMAREVADKRQQLEESYRQLERAYEMETAAKRALEDLVRMKSMFVATASHELRSPLAVARLYAEILEDGSLGTYDAETTRAHAAIAAAISRLSSIVADLMDAALLERGEIRLDFAEVDVDVLVDDLIREAEVLYGASGVQVVRTGPPSEVTLVADALRVRQVLDNLVSNAVKYSDGSGLVEVSATRTADGVAIEVTDAGRGVRPEDRARLFEYFGRPSDPTGTQPPGLGLGLAISERIARAHGGALRYRPNPLGKGSVFALELPRVPPETGDRISIEGDYHVS